MTTEIQQLGYLGFGVSDMAGWTEFATNILGIQKGQTHGDKVGLRIDDYAQRFLLVPSEADQLAFAGLQVADKAAMEAVAERVQAAGIDVQRGGDAASERCVEDFIYFEAPGGVRIEVFHGPAMASTPFSSNLVEHGFKTGDLGLGHLVIRALDLEETLQFLTDVLGFRLSDRIICDIGGYHVNIAFTHCNARHHSIAVGENLPKNIHHFMLEVNHIDDVGKCWDRVVNSGMTVWNALGRHPNDRMLSFYAETPSGFQFEFGWGGLEIEDDETWETYVYDRISDWGHEHPAVMFKKLFRKQKGDTA